MLGKTVPGIKFVVSQVVSMVCELRGTLRVLYSHTTRLSDQIGLGTQLSELRTELCVS